MTGRIGTEPEKLNARRIAHHVRGLNLRGTLNVVLKKSRITRVHEPGAGPVLTHSPSISTATKYRNTTTAICHPARLCATPPCSATNMVAVARSSGRRGRRFKSCHPDQRHRPLSSANTLRGRRDFEGRAGYVQDRPESPATLRRRPASVGDRTLLAIADERPSPRTTRRLSSDARSHQRQYAPHRSPCRGRQ